MSKNSKGLVVNARVREYAKQCGKVNVSESFLDGLNNQVAVLIEQAVIRAEANKRKTLRAQDA
jgi:histone H3/H4